MVYGAPEATFVLSSRSGVSAFDIVPTTLSSPASRTPGQVASQWGDRHVRVTSIVQSPERVPPHDTDTPSPPPEDGP